MKLRSFRQQKGLIMDWTIIGTGISVVSLIYVIIRNFKTDINMHLDKMEKRIDTLEERMFLLSTGKTLAQAILEERLNKEKGE
jgi:hypothetical protein